MQCFTTSTNEVCLVQKLRNLNDFLHLVPLSFMNNNIGAWSKPVLTRCSTSIQLNQFYIWELERTLSSLQKMQSFPTLLFHQVKGLPLKWILNRSQFWIQISKSWWSASWIGRPPIFSSILRTILKSPPTSQGPSICDDSWQISSQRIRLSSLLYFA